MGSSSAPTRDFKASYGRRRHTLSHSGTEPATIAAHKAIVRWYMDRIADFLGALDAVEVTDSLRPPPLALSGRGPIDATRIRIRQIYADVDRR